ncbi:MAG: ABC transporter ATP-binding protein [Pseudomonadota bacterium]
MRNRDTVLDIRDLKIGFPVPDGRDVTVVDGVNLSVRHGEIVGLVGESGSGKSMLALAAMGLVPKPGRITAGSIMLTGDEMVGQSDRHLQRLRGGTIGMVFQDPMTGLNPVRTVGSLLSESIRRHQGVGRAKALEIAEAALTSVGIPAAHERLSVYPHQLSGGLRQRAMIALALVNDPAVIIADEPTTALDTTIQAQILDLLRAKLVAAGAILITHDLGVAAEICDRLAVIYHGRLVETGPTAELLAAPRHPYTEGLLRAVPKFDRSRPRLTPISGQPPPPGMDRSACSFQPRCPYAISACGNAPSLVADGERSVACWAPIGAQGLERTA